MLDSIGFPTGHHVILRVILGARLRVLALQLLVTFLAGGAPSALVLQVGKQIVLHESVSGEVKPKIDHFWMFEELMDDQCKEIQFRQVVLQLPNSTKDIAEEAESIDARLSRRATSAFRLQKNTTVFAAFFLDTLDRLVILDARPLAYLANPSRTEPLCLGFYIMRLIELQSLCRTSCWIVMLTLHLCM